MIVYDGKHHQSEKKQERHRQNGSFEAQAVE